MDFFFGHSNIFRCPFLKNINEPTNFSFTSSMAFPIPARDGKGSIFEDGPNFDMAFRLFPWTKWCCSAFRQLKQPPSASLVLVQEDLLVLTRSLKSGGKTTRNQNPQKEESSSKGGN
ncbi:hypothetical protein AAHA92_13652 [Salvia divinorum]|uniref:Uncharacterized protein n=1 Tax=Salvia divinorum TaxID=28513 RepID=A0ABD1H905_SALDI